MIRSGRCGGLGICERVGELAGGLQVRVGVTTGEALVTLPADGGHPDAIGDLVNTAARLEAAAPSTGCSWMSGHIGRPAVRSATGSPNRWTRRGKRSRSWCGLRRQPRSVVPEQQRDQLPCGSRAESDTLRDCLERSRREPLRSCVGDRRAGIGKTRLVEDFMRR